MEELVGRITEQRILKAALLSATSELIAIYGRRRVGKTFLVRSVYKAELIFEFSGSYKATLKSQLENFGRALQHVSNNPIRLAPPANWSEAFHFLQQLLEPRLSEKKVIFFDEFPWLDTSKSGFLSAFGYFWNNWASKQQNLVVVICGSAASWMIRNVVNNKGGLHNRITQKIRLLPFTLQETEEYLQSRAVNNLGHFQILQLYMAMGGIPQYLKSAQPGESATQIIDRTCFMKDGMLREEFKILYQSLFEKADYHIAIVKALAATWKGLTRNEIIEQCNLSSGGTATRLLEELEESGFIISYIPFNKTAKDRIFKLADEYTLFYLKFIDNKRVTSAGTWQRLSETPSWKSWSGIAFEALCLKHISAIKKALGIPAVYTTESVWRYVPGKSAPGAQIDLLIDRSDQTINLCEMKFSTSEFTITKDYADDLRKKRDVFKEATKTRKAVFLTMITTYGVKPNTHSSLIDKELTMEVLFR